MARSLISALMDVGLHETLCFTVTDDKHRWYIDGKSVWYKSTVATNWKYFRYGPKR